MPTVPCMDCSRREVGCHATCDDYKAFRAERDAYLAKESVYQMLEGYCVQSYYRSQRKRKKPVPKGGEY